MEVNLYKAQPVVKTENVPTLIINVVNPIPDCNTLKRAQEIYIEQAQNLAFALADVLPQGTMHQLLIVLLQLYPNYFIYPIPKNGAKK
jgi:hypothetical protein